MSPEEFIAKVEKTAEYRQGHEDGYKKAALHYMDRKTPGGEFSAEEFARVMGEFVNGSSRLGKAVGEAVTREHRTLQRNVFCLCLDIVEAFADMPMDAAHMDLRNQAVLEMARKICEEGGGYYKGSRPPLI